MPLLAHIGRRMNLQYINFGNIDPKDLFSIPHTIMCPSNILEPSFITGTPNSSGLVAIGKAVWEDFVIVDNIPETFVLCKDEEENVDFSAMGLFDSNVPIFWFAYPDIIPMMEVDNALRAIIIKIIRRGGADAIAKGNDLFININGKFKKFSGRVTINREGWIRSTFPITFVLDPVFDSIYRFDTPNMTKKGNISSLSEVVCGINEALPDLTIDEFSLSVAKELAERFNLDLKIK